MSNRNLLLPVIILMIDLEIPRVTFCYQHYSRETKQSNITGTNWKGICIPLESKLRVHTDKRELERPDRLPMLPR
jgi:hypothetical protein